MNWNSPGSEIISEALCVAVLTRGRCYKQPGGGSCRTVSAFIIFIHKAKQRENKKVWKLHLGTGILKKKSIILFYRVFTLQA